MAGLREDLVDNLLREAKLTLRYIVDRAVLSRQRTSDDEEPRGGAIQYRDLLQIQFARI